MPTPATSKIPLPHSEVEFEDIVVDALRIRFKNPCLVRFGRRGQDQWGIDGVDATGTGGSMIVWQATLQERGVIEKLQRDLEQLDAKADLTPNHFVAAIGQRRDAALQADLLALSSERTTNGMCSVVPLFWDDILGDLFADAAIARKHFPLLFAPGTDQPNFLNEDLLLLTALDEHDAAAAEDWMSSFEVAVRTRLSARDLNDAVGLLTASGHVESRPFGAGEKGGSGFAYQRARITAKGRRAIRAVENRRAILPGTVPPPAVNVPIDYPDRNPELVLREQRAGFSVGWEYETTLINRDESFVPVIEEVGLRPSRLQVREGPGVLMLVRHPLRAVGQDEARELVRKQHSGYPYLERKDGRWFARRLKPGPALRGGPPAYVATETLGEGDTLLDLLTNLRILLPPAYS